jgi:hypothetical protein
MKQNGLPEKLFLGVRKKDVQSQKDARYGYRGDIDPGLPEK